MFHYIYRSRHSIKNFFPAPTKCKHTHRNLNATETSIVALWSLVEKGLGEGGGHPSSRSLGFLQNNLFCLLMLSLRRWWLWIFYRWFLSWGCDWLWASCPWCCCMARDDNGVLWNDGALTCALSLSMLYGWSIRHWWRACEGCGCIDGSRRRSRDLIRDWDIASPMFF